VSPYVAPQHLFICGNVLTRGVISNGDGVHRLAWRWVRTLLVSHISPLPRASSVLIPVFRVFRNITVSPARAHLLLKDCHLYIVELSILAQTPLVTFRRFLVLPLCRAPPFMDHSHADHLGLYNAVDVLPHPRLPG
jgi:hypothetical protein